MLGVGRALFKWSASMDKGPGPGKYLQRDVLLMLQKYVRYFPVSRIREQLEVEVTS